jgi:two-component system LytT family response regulator
MIRALIVDDEPLAREAIRDLLAADGAFEIAGECESGEQAVAAIEAMRPDVVFLDVQMPALDGFGVVERVGVERMPLTVSSRHTTATRYWHSRRRRSTMC